MHKLFCWSILICLIAGLLCMIVHIGLACVLLAWPAGFGASTAWADITEERGAAQ